MEPEPASATPANGSWRDWLSHHLRFDAADKLAVYKGVASSSTLRDATYWAEIVLSAGIATLGLTLGSPAVIIGAMLISPLMGPIMAGGLALAAGDFILATRALAAILLSSLTAVAFSTLLVALLPFREMTAEIASRTHPNTLDLVVALFSGAIGALAVCKSLRGVATSIPGVAIAVALMPPLCVTGYGVGVLLLLDRVEGLRILGGGALLFFTNLVAITFASMVVFLLLHIDDENVRTSIREWRDSDPESAIMQRAIDHVIPGDLRRIGGLPARLFLVISLLAIVFVPLKRSFDTLAVEIRQRQSLNRAHKIAIESWERMFDKGPRGESRSYIDRLDIVEDDARLQLKLRAFVTEQISGDERQAYVRRIAERLGRRPSSIELALIEIPTSRYRVEKGKTEVEPAATPPPESIGLRLHRAGQEAIATLSSTNLPAKARFVDVALEIQRSAEIAVLTYMADQPISEDARMIVEASLREQFDLPHLALRLDWIPDRVAVGFSRGVAVPAGSQERIRQLIDAIRSRPEMRLLVTSHPKDRRGRARAAAVARILADAGIDETRVARNQDPGTQPNQVVITVESASSSTGS